MAFGAEAVRFCRELRKNPNARDLANQLSASSTSVTANYRAACRARSKREFVSKLSIALEEADETVGGWSFSCGQRRLRAKPLMFC